jgi:HAD superfamily hydrolase (TIGR01549 family)
MPHLAVGADLIPDIDLVVFDKDGTLIELYHYWSQMVFLRARFIREAVKIDPTHEEGLRWALGVDERAGRLRPGGPVGLKTRAIVIKAAVDYLAGVGCADAQHLCTEAFERADEVSGRELQRFVRPIRGAMDLLGALNDAGFRVAVATVDVSRRARLALDFLGASELIDLVVGGEEVVRPKPDPEMLHIVLERLRIDPRRAVMVGDAVNDVRMGIGAGFRAAIGVLTGFAAADELRAHTPYVAADVGAISVAAGDGPNRP